MKYRNLDLELFDYEAAPAGECFRVRVAQSDEGEQRLTDAEESSIKPDLRSERLEGLERGDISAEALVELGTELANLLLPPRARDLLGRNLASLPDDTGLRVRLRIDEYPLAGIPWEFAYLPDSDASGLNGYLALDPRISLVRYELLDRAPGALTPVHGDAVRMVALLVSPSGMPTLDLAREKEYIGPGGCNRHAD